MATLITTNHQFPMNAAAPAADDYYSAAAAEPALPAFPGEDILLYRKTIDNTRLTRQADPAAHRKTAGILSWTAALVLLLFGLMAPKVADFVAGYRLERVRDELRQRTQERDDLLIRQAELRSPAHLSALMDQLGLERPKAWDVRRLEPVSTGTQLARK